MRDALGVEGDPAAPRGLASWSWSPANRGRALFGIAYLVASLVVAAAVWLVVIAPGSSGGDGALSGASIGVLVVLLANLLLIGGLAAVIGLRVLHLARGRTSDAGARLHLRF